MAYSVAWINPLRLLSLEDIKKKKCTWQIQTLCIKLNIKLVKKFLTYLRGTCVSVMVHFVSMFRPPLWARQQHARLSRSGPGFDSQSGQVSWVRFFRGFSSPVRQMSGNDASRSPNIIWPSLWSILIHYGRQWPEMLTRPKNLQYTNTSKQVSEMQKCMLWEMHLKCMQFQHLLA